MNKLLIAPRWFVKKLTDALVNTLFGLAAIALIGLVTVTAADLTTEENLTSEVFEMLTRIDDGIVQLNDDLDYWRERAERELGE